MNDSTTHLNIIVRDEGLLSYGQRVYVIVTDGYKSYTEKCPICDDTKKITLKGMEFNCPYCSNYRSYIKATKVCVNNYVVAEFIINRIAIQGEEVLGAYSRDGSVVDGRCPFATYGGFTKKGNLVQTKDFNKWNFTPHDPDNITVECDIGGEYCFLCKPDAEAFTKRLHERQKELLDKFNAEHGTDHQYPFKY